MSPALAGRFFTTSEMQMETTMKGSVNCSVVSESFVTPLTVAHQAPASMGFFRQEYWSGLPFPSPGDLLDAGIKPASLASPVVAGGFFTSEPPG